MLKFEQKHSVRFKGMQSWLACHVYKDGKVCSLAQAYREGMVIDKDLKSIVKYYDSRFWKEEKIYCQTTIDDNFTDDIVIVVMSHKLSMKFKDYTEEDFANIGCEKIKDYSDASRKLVKEKLDAMKNSPDGSLAEADLIKYKNVKEYDYCDILGIVLKDNGEDKVLEAIRILERRDDIISAEPNYIVQKKTSFE